MARSITGQATSGKQKIVLNSGTLIPNNNFGGISSVNAHQHIKASEADTRHQSQTTTSSQHHLHTMPCGSIRPYLHFASRKSEEIPKSGQSRISGVSNPFYKMRFETALVEKTHSASHAQNWKHLNKVLQLYTVCGAH